MPRKPRERTIERGIRRHGKGLQAFININGTPRYQQFDLDEDRALMRRWLEQQAKQRTRVRRGTLGADVPRYLATIADPRKRLDDRGRLAHWLRTPLAQKPRLSITKAEIKTELVKFITEPQPRTERKTGVPVPPAPLSKETANKCLSVLRSLYRDLNEHDDDPNPAALVQKFPIEKAPPKALTFELVDAILAMAPDRGRAVKGKPRSTVNEAKLRCALILDTGWPPVQIMRIDRETDIREGPPLMVRIRSRRKGKGTTDRWVSLTPRGERAFRAWLAHCPPGKFSWDSVRRAWYGWCAAYRSQQIARNIERQQCKEPTEPLLPMDLVPYLFRHTFIAQMLKASKNLPGTQHASLHSDPRQTLHYADAEIPEVAKQAVNALASAQAAAEKP